MYLENKCRQIDASNQRESRDNFLQDRRAQWEDSAIYTATTAAHRLNGGLSPGCGRCAKDRQSFGQPLLNHQAVGFRLAECATQLEAARQLTWHAAAANTFTYRGRNGLLSGRRNRLPPRQSICLCKHGVLDLSLERLAQALAGSAVCCATGLRCTDGLEGSAVGVHSKAESRVFQLKDWPDRTASGGR